MFYSAGYTYYTPSDHERNPITHPVLIVYKWIFATGATGQQSFYAKNTEQGQAIINHWNDRKIQRGSQFTYEFVTAMV